MGNIHTFAGKAKPVWVKDYQRAAHPYQEVNYVPPRCIQVSIIVDNVVNATLFVLKVW